jgi:excisionase family DNA binding protein
MVPLLTIDETAEQLKFSRRQIQRWIKAGRIPVIRFERAVRIHPETVLQIKTCGLPGDPNYITSQDYTVSRSRRKGANNPWENV